MTIEKVTLGDHELDVYPQRHAYLTNKLSKYLSGLVEGASGLTGENMAEFLGDQAYEVLCVCIPQYAQRCPEYEFLGYGSKENFESKFYVEGEDKSPTLPEIINALDVISRVNRFDVVKQIGRVVDPNLIRGFLSSQVSSSLNSSLNSPSHKGGQEASTSSGQTSPTSKVNGDSPSPESNRSEATTPSAVAGNSQS